MMIQKDKQQHALPGVKATLAAGFDLTTKHLWLVLVPVLLDVFLWLGPRLSVRPLIEEFLVFWPADPNLEVLAEQMRQLAPHTNLFTFLSLPLVGVPVLLSGIAPVNTPLAVSVRELDSLALWFGSLILLLLVGLVLTAVYYSLIAYVVGKGDPPHTFSLPQQVTRVARIGSTFFLVGILFLFFLLIIYLPLSLVTFLVSLLSPVLGVLVLLVGAVVVMWVIVAAFFLPQSVALNGRAPKQALQESISLIRHHGATVMGLILAFIILNSLLDQVLILTIDGSWMTAVSILAHAYVSTSLLTATFIFYRDRIQNSYSNA